MHRFSTARPGKILPEFRKLETESLPIAIRSCGFGCRGDSWDAWVGRRRGLPCLLPAMNSEKPSGQSTGCPERGEKTGTKSHAQAGGSPFGDRGVIETNDRIR